jgi:glycosyltransferase involved in cell wall biosynthesis
MALASYDVSVVIPYYNNDQTIAQTVASVLHQTYRPREIIIVDDASTHSVNIDSIKTQASASDVEFRFHLFDQNLGPSAARNQGMDMAKGQYIAFLDADDTWHPKKIETQIRYMQTHPHALMTGHASNYGVALTPKHGVQSFSSLLWRNPFHTPSMMLRANPSLRFRMDMRYSEDYMFILDASKHGEVHYIDQMLCTLSHPVLGGHGLSSHRWSMRKGELQCHRILQREGRISSWTRIALDLFSLIKHLKSLF